MGDNMASEIQEAAEKKYKSRMRKLKKVVKSDEEKAKFFSQLGASFEIFLPTKILKKWLIVSFFTVMLMEPL